MFASLPPMIKALLVIQALMVAAFGFDIYNNYQKVADCQTRFDEGQQKDKQMSDLETSISKREAAVDAAEAQLNAAKPQ